MKKIDEAVGLLSTVVFFLTVGYATNYAITTIMQWLSAMTP